ncbi:hypothetical protein PU02_0004 [Bartonella ancashensis]|uniref:Uncharacterized protein n=1 Tax=Bartonella ancashensis TaxID=1318743 RepID=A0A0M4LH80_9HYPH|nr:hypothetical protein PU02_0004 [Bartonella ancashensis]
MICIVFGNFVIIAFQRFEVARGRVVSYWGACVGASELL